METDPSKWVTGFSDPEHLKNTETFPTSYLKKGQRMLWVCMQCWMKLYGNSNGYNIPDKLRQKKLSQAKNYAVIIIIKTTKKYVHEAHLCSEKDPRSKWVYIPKLRKFQKLLKWREGYYPKDSTLSLQLVCKNVQEISNEQLGKLQVCENSLV